MSAKILFVDDEPSILAGYQRQLRKQFQVHVAVSGEQALQILEREGPFAVVVSDMRMPHMNGIQFLGRVHQINPDMIRMMLTGNADQQTAIEAVNEGKVFRFLNKPCPPETMTAALEDALRQYQLLVAETELLEKTLLGSVAILTEMLAMSDPASFNRACKLRAYVREVSSVVRYPHLWELELAALLAQLGHLTLPADVVARARAGTLMGNEMEMVRQAHMTSHKLLAKIPRMEGVATIILYSQKHFNGAGIPQGTCSGEEIPLGSRVLKILCDLVDLETGDMLRSVALRMMRTRNGWYDPAVLDAICDHLLPLRDVLAPKQNSRSAPRPLTRTALDALSTAGNEDPCSIGINFHELIIGDILAADVTASDGSLLLSAGNVITPPVLERLANYAALKRVNEPLYVAVG